MNQRYSIETVIEGVGWLKRQEERAIQQILGTGSGIYLDEHTHQLHFAWDLAAATMDEAIDLGRTTHHSAKAATGVYVPRTSLFVVREISDPT